MLNMIPDELAGEAVTLVVSVIVSWVTMRERVKHLSEKVAEVAKAQDTQVVVNTQMAIAIDKLTQVNERLARIEDYMLYGKAHHNAGD